MLTCYQSQIINYENNSTIIYFVLLFELPLHHQSNNAAIKTHENEKGTKIYKS
jgi:hypothetical protein